MLCNTHRLGVIPAGQGTAAGCSQSMPNTLSRPAAAAITWKAQPQKVPPYLAGAKGEGDLQVGQACQQQNAAKAAPVTNTGRYQRNPAHLCPDMLMDTTCFRRKSNTTCGLHSGATRPKDRSG